MSEPPKIVGDPKIVQKGSNVVMQCMIEGDPSPTTTWTKDDEDISASDTYSMREELLAGGKRIVYCEIQNFAKALSGTYKCRLSNENGSTTATFTVAAGVADAPEMIDKPKVIQKEDSLTIKVRCSSNSEATCSWTKDEKLVSQNDRITISSSKDEGTENEYVFLLEIKNPNKDDEAKYKCTVKNAEGSNCQSLKIAFG